MTSRFAVAVSVAVLASCAAPPSHPITVGEARARMVGMTTAQVTACMGQPTLPQTRGNVTVFSYASATPSSAAPLVATDPSGITFGYTPFAGDPDPSGFGQLYGPLPTAGCVVNVVFEAGIARAVTFVGPDRKVKPNADECTPLISRCMH